MENINKVRNVIDYTTFMIMEFSDAHSLPVTVSFDYLKKYGGLAYLEDFYETAHCENPIYTLEALQQVCSNNGGNIPA
ncbi:hypothetical protein AGMMS49982_16370 [Bacteroidia bacterium]|nr:hypothetical protein AGMMS49982_16370 [Bacteroidia bacterium]